MTLCGEIQIEGPEAGKALFGQAVDNYVGPEIVRREGRGEWSQGTILDRFQVQFPEDGAAQVRLNHEVQGILEVKATGPVKKGDLVTAGDFSEITSYRPLEEDVNTAHVTALAHGESWFLAFQFGARDPNRHEFLKAGREFLAQAHDAFRNGCLRPAIDNAASAVELLAKTELLSSNPAIELARESRSHDRLSGIYNAWGHLENTDARFVDAFKRLRKLRPAARYLERPLPSSSEVRRLIGVLDEMEAYVAHLAQAPLHDLPSRYNLFATRMISAGELIDPDASSIFPPRGGRRRKPAAA